MSKYDPPWNARYLRVQRTNNEIFKLSKPAGQAQDASIQIRQKLVVNVATVTAQTLSNLMGIPEGGSMTRETFT